ncbi:uncharacterized protein [Triticum aestivum]|uniref:uncharacterized protein n=1 Tax=Triticum aestivum TaxID=4565 RepID=UPI001D01ED1A|nr:uncharacterized protein LOC123043859 [Triticum aestivum]
MASSPASCFFSVALLARLQHQSLQLSLSAPMTLSYSKQEVGQGSCPLKADRKEEGSASSSQGGTPEPWCRGGWRRDWRRRCGFLGWLFFCITVASDVAHALRSSNLPI